MGPRQLAETLTCIIPTRLPLFIHGSPGIGKSQIVHQVAKSLDMGVIDLRASLLDPVDLKGLPTVREGRAKWATPDFLPIKGTMEGRKGIIFCDELPQAVPLVQAAFLQLILDHAVGDVQLDPEWVWVAAGNRVEDRAGSHRLLTPLLNRFGHLDLEVENTEWQEWAATNGIASEVRGFLNFRPALLNKFDPTSHDRAFPTPRSWSFVSRILPATPEHLLIQIISGLVGAGPAAEFTAFHRTYKDLPDVDALLKNPGNFKVPTDPAVLFAFSTAVSERAKGANAKILTAIHQLVDRLPDEFAILTIRDATFVNRDTIDVKKCPAADKFISKHRRVLVKV